MGDVIAWSKLNKITKMVKNLPTSLATNFGEVKDSISGLVSNFDGWKAPWTSARASKLDKVDAIANDTHSVWNSIPSGTDSVAKQNTLNTVNTDMAKDATVAKESTLNTVNASVNGMENRITNIDNVVSHTNLQYFEPIGELKIIDKYVDGVKSTSGHVALDVLGGGFLYYVDSIMSSSSSAVSGSFKVEIDGEVVIPPIMDRNTTAVSDVLFSSYCFTNITNTTSTTGGHDEVFSFLQISSDGNSSNLTPLPTRKWSHNGGNSTTTVIDLKTAKAFEDYKNVYLYNTYPIHIVSPRPLRFNKSLKITVLNSKGGYAESYYGTKYYGIHAGYSLDE